MTKNIITAYSLVLSVFLSTNIVVASDTISVKHDPVDHAALNAEGISKDQPLLVKLFDTSHAKLGKAKHQDIARMLTNTAPHLLAADIVALLRDAGFTNVLLSDFGQTPSGDYMVMDGEFTKLNPGSQAARAWIGFGAGKSKVCVTGNIKSHSGENIASFSDCSSGLGWGVSSSQMDKDTDRIGHNIANLIISWANGNLK
ncbi:MAG: hypothetical protein DRR42_24470 [Gammaproteobacteria bacterium]|nr:MAG: hypothetical protein DRR42_24470 [Gammaproteobacteria bacterium]